MVLLAGSNRYRLETYPRVSGNGRRPLSIATFDGTYSYQYNVGGGKAVRQRVSTDGNATELGANVLRYLDATHLLAGAEASSPSSLIEAGAAKVTGYARVGGVNCVRVEISRKRGRKLVVRSSWCFAPSQGWLTMAEVNEWGPPGEPWTPNTRYVTRTLKAEEVSPGLWLPTKSTFDFYKRENGQLKRWPVREYKIESVKINVPMPERDFGPPWPPGTKFMDFE